MEKILVLGISGLVGKAVAKEFSRNSLVYGTYHKNEISLPIQGQFRWDISDRNQFKEIVETVSPTVIISSLRGDFTEQLKVHEDLVNLIKNKDTRLIFCSTANVFDGDTFKNHEEIDEPNAGSEYGQFKIACEKIVMKELGDRAIIVRLPMVWGADSPRLNEIKEKIANNEEITAYKNLFLNHALDTMIAKQIYYIVNQNLKGIFHLATSTIESHVYFIQSLVNRLTKSNEKIVKEEIVPDVEWSYFGLHVTRKDIPEELNYSNQDIIISLVK